MKRPVCILARTRQHTLKQSKHIFKSMALISIYWSATKHNFSWNDNAWMARSSLHKNSKNSTPLGGWHFFFKAGNTRSTSLENSCTSINTNVGEMTVRIRHARAKAKHAPYAPAGGEWGMLHWAALVTDRLWQVSRSEQSDECHL